ncbi:MAG: thioredoxin family protein [Planctomycetales bacterium]|nr:thioredoxin family protein [Planctomycetales bacterium]
MRGMRVVGSTLVAAMMLVMGASVTIAQDAEEPRTDAIEWHRDIDEAKKIARDTGRPMLIFVTMQNCRYCTEMKQTTWVDPEMIKDTNESFVATYLDESQNRELVRSLGIRSFPTTLLATPDGRVREMVRGYVGASNLRNRMSNLHDSLLR